MEQKEKILSPKLDIIFQTLFGEKGSEQITKKLLECILKKEITDINLEQNLILRREFKDDKLGILDILVKINQNEICNIEMQIINKNNIIDRLLYYWSKLYTRQINKGYNYNELKKTISILVADFNIKGLEKVAYHSKWKIIEEENRKTILTNKLEIHILELPKIKGKENIEDELLDWLYFLENPKSERVEKIMKKSKELQEASKRLKNISADAKMQRIAELREKAIRDENAAYSKGIDDGIEQGIKKGIEQGIEQGTKEGIEQGIKQGRKNSRIEIAQNMLSKNMDISLISDITGLSIEDVKKLKDN